jgi:hypothetical protein
MEADMSQRQATKAWYSDFEENHAAVAEVGRRSGLAAAEAGRRSATARQAATKAMSSKKSRNDAYFF